MKERDLAKQRLLLPEIVQHYLKFSDLIASPQVPEPDKLKYRVERYDMFVSMTQDEHTSLSGFGRLMLDKIKEGGIK